MRDRLPMIVSITALLVAVLGITPLGEAAYNAVVPRNSVGTLQLQRNAVKAAKIAPSAIRTGHVLDGTLLTADFKAGQIPQGPKGDKGDKGDKGVKGDQGAPGVSAYQIVSKNTASDSVTTKADVAFCPSGTKVMGGGAIVTGGSSAVALTSSKPNGDSGWLAQAFEINPTTFTWSLQIIAVCAKVS